jgi:hypothetical protein
MRAIALAILIGCFGIEDAIKKAHAIYTPSETENAFAFGLIGFFLIFLIFGV